MFAAGECPKPNTCGTDGRICPTECYPECSDLTYDLYELSPQPETKGELDAFVDKTTGKEGGVCIERSWPRSMWYRYVPHKISGLDRPSEVPSAAPVPTAAPTPSPPPLPAPSPTPTVSVPSPAPSPDVEEKESWLDKGLNYLDTAVDSVKKNWVYGASALCGLGLAGLAYWWARSRSGRGEILREAMHRDQYADDGMPRRGGGPDAFPPLSSLNPQTNIGDGNQMRLTLEILDRLPDNDGLNLAQRMDVARYLAAAVDTYPTRLQDGRISNIDIFSAYEKVGYQMPTLPADYVLSLAHADNGSLAQSTSLFNYAITSAASKVMQQLDYDPSFSGGITGDEMHQKAARILVINFLRGNPGDGTYSKLLVFASLKKHGIDPQAFRMGTSAPDGTFTESDSITIFDMDYGHYHATDISAHDAAMLAVHFVPYDTVKVLFEKQVVYVVSQLEKNQDFMSQITPPTQIEIAQHIVVEGLLEQVPAGKVKTYVSSEKVAEIFEKFGLDKSSATRIALYPEYSPDVEAEALNLGDEFDRFFSKFEKDPANSSLSADKKRGKAEKDFLLWRGTKTDSQLGLLSDVLSVRAYFPKLVAVDSIIDTIGKWFKYQTKDSTAELPERDVSTRESKTSYREIASRLKGSVYFQALDPIAQSELTASMPELVRAIELYKDDPSFNQQFMENGQLTEAACETFLQKAIERGRLAWAELPERDGIRRSRAEETKYELELEHEVGKPFRGFAKGTRQSAEQIIKVK
jgi:hypothetical protein